MSFDPGSSLPRIEKLSKPEKKKPPEEPLNSHTVFLKLYNKLNRFGDPTGIRTRVADVRGRNHKSSKSREKLNQKVVEKYNCTKKYLKIPLWRRRLLPNVLPKNSPEVTNTIMLNSI
jgi:hypothetical protein